MNEIHQRNSNAKKFCTPPKGVDVSNAYKKIKMMLSSQRMPMLIGSHNFLIWKRIRHRFCFIIDLWVTKNEQKKRIFRHFCVWQKSAVGFLSHSYQLIITINEWIAELIGKPHFKFCFLRKKPVDLHKSYFIWIISDTFFAHLIIFYWYFLGYGGGYGGGYSGGHGYSGKHWYFILNANLIPEFNKIIEIPSEFLARFNSIQSQFY